MLHRLSDTIKVAGLPESVSQDMVVMYFENKKRSGGGEIKSFNLMLNKGKAVITFKDPAGWFRKIVFMQIAEWRFYLMQ